MNTHLMPGMPLRSIISTEVAIYFSSSALHYGLFLHKLFVLVDASDSSPACSSQQKIHLIRSIQLRACVVSLALSPRNLSRASSREHPGFQHSCDCIFKDAIPLASSSLFSSFSICHACYVRPRRDLHSSTSDG